MDTDLQISVISGDESTVQALAQEQIVLDGRDEHLEIEGPSRVPGAIGGWYELAVQMGVLGLPVGVLASCLANWISGALSKDPSPEGNRVRAKLIIQRGAATAEVELSAADPNSLGVAIKKALDDVDPKS